ncbi:hypothetical protein [Humibacillus sp. DSM 29435]|nr:hypothetical protein [Humibacillus sp. DSM 29435]
MPVHRNPETAPLRAGPAAVPTRERHTGPIAGPVAVVTELAGGTW